MTFTRWPYYIGHFSRRVLRGHKHAYTEIMLWALKRLLLSSENIKMAGAENHIHWSLVLRCRRLTTFRLIIRLPRRPTIFFFTNDVFTLSIGHKFRPMGAFLNEFRRPQPISNAISWMFGAQLACCSVFDICSASSEETKIGAINITSRHSSIYILSPIFTLFTHYLFMFLLVITLQ